MKTTAGRTPKEAPSKAPTPAPEIIAAIFWFNMFGLSIFQSVNAKAKNKPKEKYENSNGSIKSKVSQDAVKITKASKNLIADFLNLIRARIPMVVTIMYPNKYKEVCILSGFSSAGDATPICMA